MVEAYGTHEFETSDLEGLARYLRHRSRGLKRGKRERLERYASTVESAADRIVRLEREVRAYRTADARQQETP